MAVLARTTGRQPMKYVLSIDLNYTTTKPHGIYFADQARLHSSAFVGLSAALGQCFD